MPQQYVTPFLVLNLGSEMVFVVAQRLQAQCVAVEKSAFVLDEIISVLVSQQLITELMKAQPTYSHVDVKNIIEDVAQSSAMRLDPTSMDKLWDLITMVFKWQVTLSQDVIKLTLRHLYEIESYVTQPDTQLQLHRVQNLMENFNKIMSVNEQTELREHVLTWHKNFHVRVSLLLKLGLQGNDGSFIMNNHSAIAQEMLKNLGENIYAVTQNGKILEKDDDNQTKPDTEGCELNLLMQQILGERRKIVDNNGNDGTKMLRLAIKNKNEPDDGKTQSFDQISVNMQDNKLEDIFKDMSITDDMKVTNFKDDLLDMIGQE